MTFDANLSPAVLAKDYAAAHGFTIEPVGRRYRITYSAAQFDTFVAEVGGYPAALNAMRKYSDALNVTANSGCPCAPEGDGTNIKCPDPVTGKLGCDAPTCKGANCTSNGTTPHSAECLAEYEQTCAGGSLVLPKPGEGSVAYTQTFGRAVRNKLLYGDERGMKGVDFPFEDDASKNRIRKRARELAKPAPWQVEFSHRAGKIYKVAYATRAEALKAVRQLMPNKRMRPTYINIVRVA